MKTQAPLSELERTVFYALDKAIKSYRQFAQRNIRERRIDITIDQWLTLKTIKDYPDLTQKEIAEIVFKDYASVTRIIELLVAGGYLKRSFHHTDRRRYKLELTPQGEDVYKKLVPIVQQNRQTALQGLSENDIQQLKGLLQKITDNCSK